MEAICDLNGLWGAFRHRSGILAPSVPTHHPNLRMLLHPGCRSLLVAVWQQVYYAVADQVHQDSPEPVTAPKREIVYSKLDDLSGRKIRQIHHPPEDRLARGWHAEPCAEPCPKVAAGC